MKQVPMSQENVEKVKLPMHSAIDDFIAKKVKLRMHSAIDDFIAKKDATLVLLSKQRNENGIGFTLGTTQEIVITCLHTAFLELQRAGWSMNQKATFIEEAFNEFERFQKGKSGT